MFVNIVKKIYLVNKSSVGIIGRDMRYEYIDNYLDHKKSFPCLSFMYRYWAKEYEHKLRGLTILVINDNEYNIALRDYCNYLSLDYVSYLLIKKHSDFCTQYIDNCGEMISRYDNTISIINESAYYDIVRVIQDNFDMFPAEYAINCLDTPWAKKKYMYFRAHDIYGIIKDSQRINHANGENIAFSEYKYNDQAGKRLMNQQYYEETIHKLEANNIDIPYSHSTLLLQDFCKHTKTMGYDRYSSFKYNMPLARYLEKKGYRIDAIIRNKN